MRVQTLLRGPAILIALVFALTACGGAATTTPTPDDEPDATQPSGTDAATAQPTEEAPEGAREFTVAFTSIGISHLPLYAAIDELRAQGYTIDTPELAESELVTEGVAQGRFQFGNGTSNSTLIAIEQGAPIQWIGDRNANEWLVYAREGIQTCEELVNSRVAIHSPGSVSGAMLRDWVRNNCPDEPYEPLIIEGSPNRLAALLADQIDASPVEFGDALVLDDAGGFHPIINFARDLPGLHPSTIYGHAPWMEENAAATRALLREVLLQHRRINTEVGYLLELMQRYIPEQAEDLELAETITQAFVDAQLFDNNGGLDDEAVAYTIGFFGPDGTGDTETELSAADVADLSYLESVLDEIGRE